MDDTVRFRLRSEGEGGAQTFLLSDGEHLVGSAGVCGIVLTPRGVSRRHARLQVAGEAIDLEDLGSKNGTRLNGRRVHRAAVQPGDRLTFGSACLILERIDPQDAVLAVVVSAEGEPAPGPAATPRTTELDGGEGPPAAPYPAGLAFPPEHVVGRSAAMAALYGELRALARSDLPVLVAGETGTGKEHVARILHASSARSRGPLVAINCAAIPAELLEAELFGIGKGVATGVAERPGKFVEAHGGTLFLDEIGDMPVPLQAKLLRALQEREVHPLGRPPLPVDVRIVAATNAEPQALLGSGRLRADLYYRIAGGVARLPSLRERRGDLPALVGHFARRFSRQAGKPVRGLTVKALRLLAEYPWPGNVRELEHEVQRLVYLCPPGEAIDSSMLPEHITRPTVPGTPESESLDLNLHLEDMERRLIQTALERTGGNQSAAARLLRVSRNGLAQRIKRLGLG